MILHKPDSFTRPRTRPHPLKITRMTHEACHVKTSSVPTSFLQAVRHALQLLTLRVWSRASQTDQHGKRRGAKGGSPRREGVHRARAAASGTAFIQSSTTQGGGRGTGVHAFPSKASAMASPVMLRPAGGAYGPCFSMTPPRRSPSPSLKPRHAGRSGST